MATSEGLLAKQTFCKEQWKENEERQTEAEVGRPDQKSGKGLTLVVQRRQLKTGPGVYGFVKSSAWCSNELAWLLNSLVLSTCPAKNQAGCIERVVHHSHENQKFYLFKIAINEKCQKPKLTVKAIMVAMATAV